MKLLGCVCEVSTSLREKEQERERERERERYFSKFSFKKNYFFAIEVLCVDSDSIATT